MKPREFKPSEFTAAIRNTEFDTPLLRAAQAVYLALPADEQRRIVRACSGLGNIPGTGHVTAFEIMVTVAQAIPGNDRDGGGRHLKNVS